MIISNAQIGMAAQRDYREEHSVNESFGLWGDRQIPVIPVADTEPVSYTHLTLPTTA